MPFFFFYTDRHFGRKEKNSASENSLYIFFFSTIIILVVDVDDVYVIKVTMYNNTYSNSNYTLVREIRIEML